MLSSPQRLPVYALQTSSNVIQAKLRHKSVTVISAEKRICRLQAVASGLSRDFRSGAISLRTMSQKVQEKLAALGIDRWLDELPPPAERKTA